MASSARAANEAHSYWEQFYSALTVTSREEADKWTEQEVARYVRDFGLSEGDAWRTIACNLAFFAGYFETHVVRKIRTHFGGLDECFETPEFSQVKRQCLNESGKPAKDSPV
jgi:hypothetical protein